MPIAYDGRVIDTGTEFGARAARRLSDEAIAWLVTVTPSGVPVPIPVWFLWEDGSVLIYSQAGKAKLRNIERNPRVALHLDGNGRGGDIVTISGDAEVSDDAPADQLPAYVEKYSWGFDNLGMTAAEFAAEYSVPIRIRIRRLTGF
jgi:PPOX class probable F420-dependent enzyme